MIKAYLESNFDGKFREIIGDCAAKPGRGKMSVCKDIDHNNQNIDRSIASDKTDTNDCKIIGLDHSMPFDASNSKFTDPSKS